MYKATIKDTSFDKGKLTAIVEFKNEDTGDVFDDTFNTTQEQDQSWPHDLVQRRLASLNSLPDLKGKIEARKGVMIEPEEDNSQANATPRDEYRAKLTRFNKYVSAIVVGFTDEQATEFKDLKQWLTENFKPEYVDLFD